MIDVFVAKLAGFVWNFPVVILCLFSGFYFTFRSSFVQLRSLPHALKLIAGKYDNPNEKGHITHFQALSAALSGTIGLGNIAGVAIAIALGGPGAVFWMWVIGFFGMATKYVECTLGTHYREEDEHGNIRGGAMYYITKGLGEKWKPLAIFFAVAIVLASWGSASLFQTNQAASALYEYYSIPHIATGIVLFILTGAVIIGGISRIGMVASKIVPFMCVVYVLGAVGVCLVNIDKVPTAFMTIFLDAFTGISAAGGVVGSVIKIGVKRAVFSNEAGLGSAPIAHAAVKTDYPVREGMVASIGPLIDTVIVCTATALVIILSGNYGTERYQSVSDNLVSFETPLPLSQGWDIRSEGPAETDPLRAFREGDSILRYSGTFGDHTDAFLPMISLDSTILRLSYFKEKGDMDLALYRQDGMYLGTVKLSQGESTLAFDGQPLLSVENYGNDQKWSSLLLTFSDKGLAGIKKGDLVRLQLRPKGQDVTWYFDRFQPVRLLSGIALTTASFDQFFNGFGSIFVTFAVFFFAFSTLITWSYYGEVGVTYLFGERSKVLYKWVFVLLILYGSVESLSTVINFTDAMVGLMVIPNTIAILLLSKKVFKWTDDYFKALKKGDIKIYK